MKYPRAYIFIDASENLDPNRIRKLLGSKKEVYFQSQTPKDISIEREMKLLAKYDRIKARYYDERLCIATDATLISEFFRMEVSELNVSIYWMDDKKTCKSIRPAVMALGNLQEGVYQLHKVPDLHGHSMSKVCDLIPNFDWRDYPSYDLEYLCRLARRDLMPLRKSILSHLKTVTRAGIINRLDLP